MRLLALCCLALAACGGGGGGAPAASYEVLATIPNTSGEQWPEADGDIILTSQRGDCKDQFRRAYLQRDGLVDEEGCWEPWEPGKSGYFIVWGEP